MPPRNIQPKRSAIATTTVSITAINDPPMLSSVTPTVAFLDGSTVQLSPTLSVSDPDNVNLPSATVKIAGGTFLNDGDQLTANVAGSHITASYDPSTETLTLYQLLLLSCFFALSLPFGFVAPNWTDAGVMIFNGMGNALGQYLWTRSLYLAPTSAVVPFNYFSLVWALILGFIVWGDVPTLPLMIGSAIVVGTGLFLLWSETRR